MHILVVEDAVDLAHLLGMILSEKVTNSVTVCTDRFQSLWSTINWEDVDAIVCDRKLGDYDGVELLTWLTQHHPRIRRVMLTGSLPLPENDMHAHKVLIKPVAFDVLLHAVEQ